MLGWYKVTFLKAKGGAPRWCDRFGQTGIKVSFGGSCEKIVRSLFHINFPPPSHRVLKLRARAARRPENSTTHWPCMCTGAALGHTPYQAGVSGSGAQPRDFFGRFDGIFSSKSTNHTRPTAPRWKAHIEACHKYEADRCECCAGLARLGPGRGVRAQGGCCARGGRVGGAPCGAHLYARHGELGWRRQGWRR